MMDVSEAKDFYGWQLTKLDLLESSGLQKQNMLRPS